MERWEERPSAGSRPSECDLILQGGITSGVVYPGAVQALARRFRFRGIGGASAGAIAATLAAAGEYGRARGAGMGFGELESVIADLQRPGFLFGLFQPTRRARPLWRVATSITSSRNRFVGLGRAAAATLLRTPLVSVGGGILTALIVSSMWTGSILGGRVAIYALAGVAAVVGFALTLLASLTVLARRLYRGINENGFGICSGMGEGEDPGFTEWLHDAVQRSAGLPLDRPLTFNDLLREGIDLRLITTDLSRSRPTLLPFKEDRRYLFKREDMETLFPRPLVDHLVLRATRPDDLIERLGEAECADYLYLPVEEMPVVMAFRLSLSFPLLISAVRLYSFDESEEAIQASWFSDGGISSNFPIHFFEWPLPQWPTFGLSFQPYPREAPDREKRRRESEDDLWLPIDPQHPPPHRWTDVRTPLGLVRQVIDALQTWRDELHSELPGIRDRICHVRLASDEGGLNLAMPPETITRLISKGERAGELISQSFGGRQWENHRFTRYLTLMQMLQIHLKRIDATWPSFEHVLLAGAPMVEHFRDCHGKEWCRAAAAATRDLLALVEHWGPEGAVDFNQSGPSRRRDGDATRVCEPVPTPTMRIVADV